MKRNLGEAVAIIIAALILLLVVLIVVGGLAWLATTIWGAVLS